MKYVFLLLLTVVQISCTYEEKRSFDKAWFYKDDLSREEQLENIYSYGGTAEYGFTGASFLDLRPDGNFTSYFTAFDYGTWKLSDSTIILTDHNRGRMVLDVKKLEKRQMICLNQSTRKVYRFNGFENATSSPGESPFSIENNRWRVPAAQPETDDALRSRLKNHFRWWESYFTWALHNKLKVLDIRSTPSVLEMYANGFELKYYDYQFPEWKHIFHDTSDCWRAYQMVYYLMYQKNIHWPKTENRFEGFVSAFRQLQEWMDIDPRTYLPPRNSVRGKVSGASDRADRKANPPN